MVRLLTAWLLLAAACSNGPAPASAQPSPSGSPSPPAALVRLRPPALAILDDAQVGLPRVSGRDHLTAAEAAGGAADQPLALQTYTSWGWTEESTRAWSGGGRSADALVLATLRPSGARRAFTSFAQQTDVAPYSGMPCPPRITGLDGCHMGVGSSNAVITGWLAEEVFVVAGHDVDVVSLAAAQAGRLRA